jgi:hypothetical protein
MLIRYWLEVSPFPHPTALNLGAGVTAFSLADAVGLLRAQVGELSDPVKVTENVDISTLDSKHVQPNIGNTTIRGVWFPIASRRRYRPFDPNE